MELNVGPMLDVFMIQAMTIPFVNVMRGTLEMVLNVNIWELNLKVLNVLETLSVF